MLHLKGQRILPPVHCYPTSYELRLLNKVTIEKNQGKCGSCCSFESLASLESYLMPIEV
ncbi:MAG: C1 family peptidase [Candidatus Aminicenantia bacterium]